MRSKCAQQGYTAVREFMEEGESAKTMDRTELKKLLTFCRESKGKVGALVIYMSRGLLVTSTTTGSSCDSGELRRLCSICDRANPDHTASGQLMEGILAALHSSRTVKKRIPTRAGMLAALQRGRWTWVAPFGYRSGNRTVRAFLSFRRTPSSSKWRSPRLPTGKNRWRWCCRVSTALGLRNRGGQPLHLQPFH